MKKFKWLATTAIAAVLMAGCGGGGGETSSNPRGFKEMISFGDSLSDVGTHAVGAVAAAGGGKYTVNSATAKNWTQLVAPQFGLAVPCPAQTGLDSAATPGFMVPIVNNPACTNYAQGGSRVTDPTGPGNRNWPDPASNFVGQLTVPVLTQMQRSLTNKGGNYNGTELITVLAGGNDIFAQVGAVQVGATTTFAAVTNMGVAGGQLAAYIDQLLLQRGAKSVVVVNLPDVSKTPFALSPSNPAGTTALISAMVTTFNQQLAAGLAGKSNYIIVDAYQESINQFNAVIAGPGRNNNAYGIDNGTTPACGATGALVCTTANTTALGDVSRYQYADGVHPTPFGYELLAKFVLVNMAAKGWL
jgi:outer membrane lipase/esterase